MKFPKLQMFLIFWITNFWNCPNWKINKFLEFFQFEKPKCGCKNWKFWNCLSIQYFALVAILPILIFSLWNKSTSSKNLQFSQMQIFIIEIFWNAYFYNWNFLEFSKLQMFRIFRITSFWNCPNCKINKFLEFFQLEKPKMAAKIGIFGIVRSFNISH